MVGLQLIHVSKRVPWCRQNGLIWGRDVQSFRRHIDRLMPERRNPSALAIELRLSCINPSIWRALAMELHLPCIILSISNCLIFIFQYLYFDRDDVALPNFAKFFKKSSDEERDHAEKLMKYQNQRGGRIVLQDIQVNSGVINIVTSSIWLGRLDGWPLYKGKEYIGFIVWVSRVPNQSFHRSGKIRKKWKS